MTWLLERGCLEISKAPLLDEEGPNFYAEFFSGQPSDLTCTGFEAITTDLREALMKLVVAVAHWEATK
jgi:hypothetical protein